VRATHHDRCRIKVESLCKPEISHLPAINHCLFDLAAYSDPFPAEIKYSKSFGDLILLLEAALASRDGVIGTPFESSNFNISGSSSSTGR
jgi:hypothetical protein